MPVLHLIHRAPPLQQALWRVRAGDGILLMGDATYGAMAGSAASRLIAAAEQAGVTVYCLRPDLEARGIAQARLAEGIEPVDYDGFVDLVVRFPRNCSW